MKVTIDIDCTPEDARRFMGLPDPDTGARRLFGEAQGAVADGAAPELFADMRKSWGPMSEAGPSVWRQMIGGASVGPR